MVIPKIVHFVYCGAPVPAQMQEMMNTVNAMTPNWEHKLWTHENLEEIDHRFNYADLLKFYRAPVHVSDVVRLLAVEKFGGIYVDCDVTAIRPLDSLLQYDAFAATQDGTGQICPAVFGATPHHPWIVWQALRTPEYSAPDQPWNVALMTDAPRQGLTLLPTHTFYPWLWNTPKEDRIIHPDTLIIHHWKGSWAPWVIRERD